MTNTTEPQEVGVAFAKARLSELLTRIERGERILLTRRGRRVAALVPPEDAPTPPPRYLGLAAFTGALADWDDLNASMERIVGARARARDRDVPGFER